MNITIFVFVLYYVVVFLIGFQTNDYVKNDITDVLYKQSLITHTIACDDYTIPTIKSLGYTGIIQSQGIGCLITGIEHTFDIPSLDVAIVFDDQYSPYFLDQSKKPIIVLSGNEIITTKEDSLIVIKNDELSLQDFVSGYFVGCENQEILSGSLEGQVICKTNNKEHWYHIQQGRKNFYITKTYPTAKTQWRYEMQ